MGVHYPTDVIGGFALATAVVLLLAPIAMAVLVPLCHALSRTAAAPLIRAPQSGNRPRGGRRGRTGGTVTSGEQPPESDLAA